MVKEVTYGELLELGGFYSSSRGPETAEPQAQLGAKAPLPEKPPSPDNSSFLWFFRTGFQDFDRQAMALDSGKKILMEKLAKVK